MFATCIGYRKSSLSYNVNKSPQLISKYMQSLISETLLCVFHLSELRALKGEK